MEEKTVWSGTSSQMLNHVEARRDLKKVREVDFDPVGDSGAGPS